MNTFLQIELTRESVPICTKIVMNEIIFVIYLKYKKIGGGRSIDETSWVMGT